MIEVFKTDINDSVRALKLAEHIHKLFKAYTINFDLDDCDKIMRVVSTSENIEVELLIEQLKGFGFHAEVLSDDDLTINHNAFESPTMFLN